MQLIREHNPLITIPDDPLDFESYFDVLDQSTWQVVVKPLTFLDDAASGVVWGVASSRWANWHDMAKIILEDSELSVVCTRYLEGDPLPWDGADLRHGTLVISIEDKSGIHIGTSNGGSIFDGLVRTVAEFADDFIDSTQNLISDTEAPEEYFLPGFYATNKEWPYVVYRTGDGTGIQQSKFINSPAKGVQVNVGGHSMPGVVCGPWGNLGAAGHTGTHQRMKRSARPYRPLGTSLEISSSSAAWAVPSTPCYVPYTKTPSSRGGPSNRQLERRTRAGHATSSTSKTARIRRTPSPR
jgi:hypothetical protein